MDLPDDLVLPLVGGEPYWYWLGGRPALDFVNTLRERWWRQVETLVTPRDLLSWLDHVGFSLPSRVHADTAVLGEARELREAIDAAANSLVATRQVSRASLEVIDLWLPHATVGHRLRGVRAGPPLVVAREPSDPLRHALGLIALDAAQMIGTEERSRVRICASQTCSARFYDRSPRATRRWCSMAACGNVAKVRRHRAARR